MKVVFGCVFINIIYGAPETAPCSGEMDRLLRARKSNKNRAGWESGREGALGVSVHGHAKRKKSSSTGNENL